jgi:two-component system, NtrC family, nitrogen regulation sensor histidine kinase GlnL
MKKTNILEIAVTVDRKMRISSFVKGIEQISGKSVSEVKGMPYYEFIPGLTKSTRYVIKEVLRNGMPIKFKEKIFFCEHSRSNADFHVTPLINEDRIIHGVQISARIHADCEIARTMDHQKRLTDIGRVAATLAHGVRNPLSIIRGATTYIIENYSTEKNLSDFIKIINEEVSRIDKFIIDFLSTSTTDKGLHKININTVLKKIKTSKQLMVKAHNIIFAFEFGKVPPVIINPLHLEHAILNVINNAVEAISGNGRVTVRSRLVKHNKKDFSVIEVSDTGLGMPLGKYNDIIAGPHAKGKGLGLFITDEILRSCGGHLEIKSIESKGTTVRLFLPVIHD